jgi:hypothetical protein
MARGWIHDPRFTPELPTQASQNKCDILLNKPPLNVENTIGDSEYIAAISDQWGGLMGRQQNSDAKDR